MKSRILSWKSLTALTLGLPALSLALPVFTAQEAFARRGGGEGKERVFKELNLTQEQRDKLAEIRKSNKEKIQAKRESVREARKKLKDAMKSGASVSDLRSLHKEVQKQKNEISDLRFEKMLAVRDVLTPEQRKKFQELMAEKREKFKGKRGGKGKGRWKRGE